MKKGFTLIELLVVLVVIGILIALILPNTLKAIRQGNVKECASNIRSINTAIQMCYTDKRNWAACGTTADLVDGHYLEANPVCPIIGGGYIIADVNVDGLAGKAVEFGDHFQNWPPRGEDHL